MSKEEENLGSFYMGRMRPPPQPQRVLPRGALSIIILLSFAGIIWYAYPSGQEKYDGVDVPVITADKAPYKFKPDDPGGLEVRHRDSTVFDPLEKKTAEVEHLLPAPEQPVDKDAALKGKVDLSEKKPQLNLDLQMQDVGGGTEKIVSATEEKPKAAPKPAASRAEAKTAPKPGAKAAPVAGGAYIQLGSYRDVSGARRDWSVLQKKYPQYLKGLSMKTVRVDLGGKGIWYRLYAGTLTDARARDVCGSLRKENAGGCIVAKL